MTEIFTIDTTHGRARAHVLAPDGPGGRAAALVLGHGAGGGVNAPDLQAAGRAALSLGFAVALVEQPYRVSGRRAPPPAPHLDSAWLTVIDRLRQRWLPGVALVCGGRSMGARVACRTAGGTGAAGLLCLAFPLLPPRRAQATKPPASRLPELEAVTVPTLVVQGTGDRFGIPAPGPGREVVQVRGDHSLRTDLDAVSGAVAGWLALLPA